MSEASGLLAVGIGDGVALEWICGSGDRGSAVQEMVVQIVGLGSTSSLARAWTRAEERGKKQPDELPYWSVAFQTAGLRDQWAAGSHPLLGSVRKIRASRSVAGERNLADECSGLVLRWCSVGWQRTMV